MNENNLENLIKNIVKKYDLNVDTKPFRSIFFDFDTFYFELKNDFNSVEIEDFFNQFLEEIYEKYVDGNNKCKLTSEEQKNEIANALEKIIESTNHIYRHDEAIISDELFDGNENILNINLNGNNNKKHLYHLLKIFNSNSKLFKAHLLERPKVDKNGRMINQKVKHPSGGKGSTLSKFSTLPDMVKEIEHFLNDENSNNDIYVSEKLDGSSLYLTYDYLGRLIRAVTRGDGIEGEDVTANALKIPNIPKQIDISKLNLNESQNIQVRGEVLLYKDNLEKINETREEKGQKKYSNPRNGASGAMNDLDGTYCNFLNFSAFEMLLVNNINTNDENVIRYEHNIKLDFFKENNFSIPNEWKISNIEEFKKIFMNYEEGENRKNLKYAIDGLVVIKNGVNDKNFEVNNDRSVTYGFACKFSPVKEKTIIKDIEYNVKSSGAISIVLILEPINIDGTVVQRLLFSNEYSSGIKEYLSTINIGDEIIIAKMGDIIPKMLYATKYEEDFKNIGILLNNIVNKNSFKNNRLINPIEFILPFLDYLENATSNIITTDNKDINLKFRTYLSELLVSNHKLELKDIIKFLLNDFSKKLISDKQKIINNTKDTKLKKQLQNELKEFKITIKTNISEIVKLFHKDNSQYNVLLPDSNKRTVNYISSCPKCGHSIENLSDKQKSSYCNNPNCEGVILSTLEKYAKSIGGKGINIGYQIITFLNSIGKLREFKDFYKLKKEDFINENGKFYEGWGEKSINNLLTDINQKMTNASDYIFIKSLNIRNYSDVTSKNLLQVISLKEILDIDFNNDEEVHNFKEKVLNIKGFDEKLINYFIDYFKENKNNVLELLDYVTINEYTKKISASELSQSTELNIVLTGSINENNSINGFNWTNRSSMTKVLNKNFVNGYKINIVGSVSAKTDYLISDDLLFEKISLLVKDNRINDALKLAESGTSKIKNFLKNNKSNISNVITTNDFVKIVCSNNEFFSDNEEVEEVIDNDNKQDKQTDIIKQKSINNKSRKTQLTFDF